MLRVECVTRVQDLAPLKDEWDRLVARSLAPELYVTHEWVTLWCEHFIHNEELFLLLVLDGARLVGVAPLMKSARVLRGLPLRQLGFLLNGCNVRGSLLLAADHIEPGLAALLDYLSEVRDQWDLLSLYGMSEESGIPGALDSLLRSGRCPLSWLPVAGWVNSVIVLDEGWESYLSRKTVNFRRQVKRERRDLEKAGDPVFARYASVEAVDRALEDFLSVEARSWKVKTGVSLSARQDYQEFYRAVCQRFATRDAWRQWELCVDGIPVACIFGLIYEGTLYAEKTTYTTVSDGVSPGNAVIRFAIEDAFEERVAKEIDLDQQTAFTGRWESSTKSYCHVEIFNRSPYSLALYGLKRLLRVWRGTTGAGTSVAEQGL
ncbi:MAG: GNAT family N-acetyltransferase [Nitrospira sp.]|jgi:CelD/BcsL family acetyltransferase involved in cellulose biosynthesis